MSECIEEPTPPCYMRQPDERDNLHTLDVRNCIVFRDSKAVLLWHNSG